MKWRWFTIAGALNLLRSAKSALLIGAKISLSWTVLASMADAAQTEPHQSENPNPQAPAPVVLPPRVVIGTNNYAERTAEQLPLAVTVLDAKGLQRAGIDSTVDLGRAVPNLSQSHAGLRSNSDTYSVRGLGNTEFLSDPAVVLYVDDAPFGDVVTYATDLLSVDHIDVYRGPQGTVFGKNSEAGVINVITRQPGNQFEGEAHASFASFDTRQYQALAMGPVAENKVYFNLAGQYSRSDGFIDNVFLHSHADEQNGLEGRAALKWTPAENWSADFTASGNKFDDGTGLVSLTHPREPPGAILMGSSSSV